MIHIQTVQQISQALINDAAQQQDAIPALPLAGGIHKSLSSTSNSSHAVSRINSRDPDIQSIGSLPEDNDSLHSGERSPVKSTLSAGVRAKNSKTLSATSSSTNQNVKTKLTTHPTATATLVNPRSASTYNPSAEDNSTRNETCRFHCSYYMGFLDEGVAAKCMTPYPAEKDVISTIKNIQDSFHVDVDWQIRMKNLGILQGLALGVMQVSKSQQEFLITQIKGIHDSVIFWHHLLNFSDITFKFLMQVSSQISDLRSTVSKEACRTVAVLAR